MRVIDPGHTYQPLELDRNPEWDHVQFLIFVKRVGPGYPGNQPPPYPGTTMQEVLRVLIDRTQYLNRQQSHWINRVLVFLFRICIHLLEYRAARRHGKRYKFRWRVESLPVGKDGHVIP